MLSPDFDLRDRDDDSQVWGRRPSNLETELQQMQDVSQLYHNPAYPTTDLQRWLQKGSIWSKVPAVTAGPKADDLEMELERMLAVEHGPQMGPVPCTVTAAPAVEPALPPSTGAVLPSVPEPVPHVCQGPEPPIKDGLIAGNRAQCLSKDGLLASSLQSAVPGPLDGLVASSLQSAVPAAEATCAQGPSKDGLVASSLHVPGPLAPEVTCAEGPSKDGLIASSLQSVVPGPQGPSKDGLIASSLQSAVPGPLALEVTCAEGASKDGFSASSLQSPVPGPLAPDRTWANKDGFIAGSLSAVPGPLASEALPTCEVSVPGPPAEVVDESANADQQLHQLGWKLQTGALRVKYNSDGELVFQESLWFEGRKEGFVFKSGVDGVGYYPDTAVLPCGEFRGAKPNRVYTLRDGILGYHVDRPAKLDVAEAEAFKRLGWFQAVAKPQQAVDDAASAAEAAKAPSREPEAASDGGYTWKAAYNFVHRLKQNSKRLSECSEQLRLLLASTDECDKKKLIRLVTESKGKVEDLEMKVSHEQSLTEFETAKTRVTPVTEAELCQIYGSRAREVMDYKVSVGEFQEDPNLPGSRVFLIARDLAETGTDHKKSSLTLAWPCCIVCQWTCDNESRLA